MTKLVKHLWAGEAPLRQAFWQYAVGYGLLLNIITPLAFLALIARDANTALIVLVFALPVTDTARGYRIRSTFTSVDGCGCAGRCLE